MNHSIVMSCSCIVLETRHGQGDCKCARYREEFPNCACERESVSKHSPGPVDDSEVLVRTLFRERHIDQDRHFEPSHFRLEAVNGGSP